MELADYLIIALLGGIFVGAPLCGWLYMRAKAARFEPDGAIADAILDADGNFALEIGGGGAVDLYLQYRLEGVGRGRGGGMAMLLEITREPGDAGYRGGAAPFASKTEYLLGDALRPFGEAPLGEALDRGPIKQYGRERSRGLLLARVPPGGRLIARGRAQPTTRTQSSSFLLFAKPPK